MSTVFFYFKNENDPDTAYRRTMMLGMLASDHGAERGCLIHAHIPNTLEFSAQGFQDLVQAERFAKHAINHAAFEFIDWFDIE